MTRTFFAALATLMTFVSAGSAAQDEIQPEFVSAQPSTALPPYTFACESGLYSTLYGYLSVKKVAVPQQHCDQLTVPGFSRPIPIQVVQQSQPAPLVVVLLGISGEATSDFSKLWPCWYAHAGYNVLTFNSTFRPEFLDIGGADVGVSGNVWAESAKVRDIINAFLAKYQGTMAPTKIGLVGMSYGAVQALILGQMAAEGKVPFKIDAIQAYSPPLDMRQTAVILDDWYNQYRFRYTLIEMYVEVMQHKARCTAGCTPLPDDLLHAAIATSFQRGLKEAVLANNTHFCLQLFSNDPVLRSGEADQWGFTRYAYDLAMPWWRERLKSNQIDDLIDAAQVKNLLRHQPACSEAILAIDDPFNDPADTREIREQAKQLPLTLLPRGGHLGYIADPWTRAKLMRLFECAAKPPAPAAAK